MEITYTSLTTYIPEAERIRQDVAKLREAILAVYRETPTIPDGEMDAYMETTGCRKLQLVFGEIQDLHSRRPFRGLGLFYVSVEGFYQFSGDWAGGAGADALAVDPGDGDHLGAGAGACLAGALEHGSCRAQCDPAAQEGRVKEM